MISVIVCSKDPDLFNRLIQNIAGTIGCSYEVLVENNNLSKNSITTVYNRLSEKAIYEYLLFIHEDMEFLGVNWGNRLVQLMNENNVGLVGLSGSIYKSKYPAIWSASKESGFRISGNQYNKGSYSSHGEKLHEVAVIDGCFMATKKTIFLKYLFDQNLQGFHGYDIDLSLNIGKEYKIVVSAEIDFLHYSTGIQNQDWLASSLYVHKKWKSELPKIIGEISHKEILENDYLALQNVYNVYFLLKKSIYQIIHYYCLFICKYFKFNKFKYTKKTLQYVFLEHWSIR